MTKAGDKLLEGLREAITMTKLMKENEELRAENEKLRAALKPFAEQVGRPVNIYEYEGVRMAFVDQDVLDRLCRAAAAALKETTKGQDES